MRPDHLARSTALALVPRRYRPPLMTGLVQQAREHLSGQRPLAAESTDGLILGLLDGQVTDDARIEVLNLLDGMTEEARAGVLGDGRLARRLAVVIPARHALRERANPYIGPFLQDLSAEARAAEIWHLLGRHVADGKEVLDPRVTDDALNEVLDLIATSPYAERKDLFQDGRLGRRLAVVIPSGHRLRPRLNEAVVSLFGMGQRPRDLLPGLRIPARLGAVPGKHQRPSVARRLQRALTPPPSALHKHAGSEPAVWPLTPLDRAFSPGLISLALADVPMDGQLTREQLGQAAEAIAGRSDQAIVRRLGLSPAEQAIGLRWLGALGAAADRNAQLKEYHPTGDPRAYLADSAEGTTRKTQLITDALTGLAPWQGLDLLLILDATDLRAIFDRRWEALLHAAIPEGHKRRPDLEVFVQTRFDPAPPHEVRPDIMPRVLFSPGNISGRLRGIDPLVTPHRREFLRIGRELADRSDQQIRQSLNLQLPREQAMLGWWLRNIGQPGRDAYRADAYLTGDWHADMSTEDLARLIARLLPTQAAWQALELLWEIDDSLLEGVLQDGTIMRLLTEIPPGHPGLHEVNDLYDARFRDARVHPGYHPPQPFSLDMVSAHLRGAAPGEELTREQVLNAGDDVAGRFDDAILPAALPPIQRKKGELYLSDLRQAITDLAARRLSGNPAYRLSSEDLGRLVRQLAGIAATSNSDRVRRVLIATLKSTTAEELAAIWDNQGLAQKWRATLSDHLKSAIPSGHPLRADLDKFFAKRLANGQVNMDVQPTRPFHLGLFDEDLAHVDISDTGDTLTFNGLIVAGYAILNLGEDPIIDVLEGLDPQSRAEAAWYLTDLRVLLYDMSIRDPDTGASVEVDVLDKVLDWLYLDLVSPERVPDAQWLRDLTPTPPASQARRLREALSLPVTVRTGEQRQTFQDRLTPEGETFRQRLRQALEEFIENTKNEDVVGYGPTEYADVDNRTGKPKNRFDLHGHFGPIAEHAMDVIDNMVGHLRRRPPALATAEPGAKPPGNIYDLFAHVEWTMKEWAKDPSTEEARRIEHARRQLFDLLNQGRVETVLTEHHADPHFDEFYSPTNEEGRIADAVFKDMLANPETVTDILNLWRAWDAEALPFEHKMFVRTFKRRDRDPTRTPEERKVREARMNQRLLYERKHSFGHESWHLWVSDPYYDYHESLPGRHEQNAMSEGGPTRLTEIWWNHIARRLRKEPGYRAFIRHLVERDYADENSPDYADPLPRLPHAADTTRYKSSAETIRLIRQVGFQSFTSGYLLGEVTKMTGPRPGSRPSVLAPAGTAEAHARLPTPVPTRPSSPTPLPAAPPPTPPPPPGLPAPRAAAAAALPPAPEKRPSDVRRLDGDLLGLPARVGAVVNVTDATLGRRDGVSGQILGAGGAPLTQEIQRRYPQGARPGDALETSAPGINADHVIHAVLPDFGAVSREEGVAQLGHTYRDALTAADRLGLTSIAVKVLSADDYQGAIAPHELQALAEHTLRTTPTRVRHVYLVRPTPADTKSAADLEAERLLRAGQQSGLQRRAEQAYQGWRTDPGFTEVRVDLDDMPVAPDEVLAPREDRLFYTLPEVFGDELRRALGLVPGALLTPGMWRQNLVDALNGDWAAGDDGRPTQYADLFPGTMPGPDVTPAQAEHARNLVRYDVGTPRVWTDKAGDQIVAAATRHWGLPITLFGRRYPVQAGPEGAAPRAYVGHDGTVYEGTAAGPEKVMTAAALLQLPGAEDLHEPSEMTSAVSDELATTWQHVNTYVTAFEFVRARLTQLAESSDAARRSAQAVFGRQVVLAFREWLQHPPSQGMLDRLGAMYADLQAVTASLEGGVQAWARPRDTAYLRILRAGSLPDALRGPHPAARRRSPTPTPSDVTITAVLDDTTVVTAPDLTTVVAPDLTTTTAPDLTTGITAPDLTTVLAPDLTTTTAPDLTTGITAPDLTTVLAPDLTTVLAPDLTTTAPDLTTGITAPDLTTVLAPDLTTTAPDLTTGITAPDLTTVLAPDLTTTAPDLTTVPADALPPGWEWLPESRGLAFPAVLPDGTTTTAADWAAAQPGVGREYAVHLPTAMIAVSGPPGTVQRHTVHALSQGWVRYRIPIWST